MQKNVTSAAKFGLGMDSREASAFEASKRGLAETRYVDMESADLKALEIGSVLLPERSRKIQTGMDSCAAVTVFSRMVADDFPMLQTPSKAQDFRSECSRGEKQAPRCVILERESENGRGAQSFDGSVGDARHEPRCVFPVLQQWIQSVFGKRQTESSNCQSSLFCTMLGRLERTAIQVCSHHFQSWNRSRA